MHLNLLHNKEKPLETEEKQKNLITKSKHKSYTLRYFYNIDNIFFHLFLHTNVYDKRTNKNIEEQGILLRSWNPLTKRGERYVFQKGNEGEGELNLKVVYLPNTKTIFEFSNRDNKNQGTYNLAEEIINISPHQDIEIKFTNIELSLS
jgi:hypothetical protein